MWLDTAELPCRLQRVALVWAVVLLVFLAWWVEMGDVAGEHWLRALPWLEANQWALRALCDWGQYPFYLLFLWLLVTRSNERPALSLAIAKGYLLAQLVGSLVIVRSLKMLLGRARPDQLDLLGGVATWIGPTFNASYHSFPSGHTADLFTSATFVLVVFRPTWPGQVALVCAVSVAVSRVALSKHMPSDLFAGALIACVVSLLVLYKWVPRRLGPEVFPEGIGSCRPRTARLRRES